MPAGAGLGGQERLCVALGSCPRVIAFRQPGGRFRRSSRMKKDVRNMSWPTWATWALIGVIVTSLVTIAATINDIW